MSTPHIPFPFSEKEATPTKSGPEDRWVLPVPTTQCRSETGALRCRKWCQRTDRAPLALHRGGALAARRAGWTVNPRAFVVRFCPTHRPFHAKDQIGNHTFRCPQTLVHQGETATCFACRWTGCGDGMVDDLVRGRYTRRLEPARLHRP